MDVKYSADGNILYKTNVGNYEYGQKPHAVMNVENPIGLIPRASLITTFNDLGKVERIEDGNTLQSLEVEYGPGQERWISTLSRNNQVTSTRIYFDDYEKTTDAAGTHEIYYLGDHSIYVRDDGGDFKCYFLVKDNLGSIVKAYDTDENPVYEASYDAWGKQTVTKNEIGLCRGYCGHEMLNDFDIINMNGRLYDPVLARFLSPDNYVQMPDNSQSFNRYSYCLNNPLKYTDPSGEFWNLVIGGVIGGIMNWASTGFQFNAKGLGYFVTGAVAGAVGAGVASGMNVSMAGGSFWAGAAGLANGVSSTGFVAGAVTGASSGFAGGFLAGAGNAWVGGSSFGNGLLSGLTTGGADALSGGVTGGLIGGFSALGKGANFWTGNAKFDLNGAYSCSGCKSSSPKLGDITGRYVGDYEGQHVFESPMLGTYSEQGGYSGVTFPDRGICVGKGVFTGASENGRALMQHEFGHVLQYRIVGASKYYQVIAKESFLNMCGISPYNKVPHDVFWTESWANYLSKQYFGVTWHGVDRLTKAAFLRYFPAVNISKELMWSKFGM